MVRYLSKISSFILLFLILVICLNEFKIVNYSSELKSIFYFLTLVFIMLSSVTTLLTNKLVFFKFTSLIIIATLIAGGIFSILHSGLNIFIYVCVLCTAIYCLIDMFYKFS